MFVFAASSFVVEAQQTVKSKEGAETVFPPVAVFQPSHQRALTYKDTRVRASLVVGKSTDSLRIQKKGKTQTIQLPEELAEVDEVRAVADDQLAVRGMVNGSGSEVVLVSFQSAKVRDKFLCYRPAISPDGKYIAFVKFYPAHFVDGTSDHYMLYALDQSPTDNRPKGVPVGDNIDVGNPVYPPAVRNSYSDNVSVPVGEQHQAVSPLFWSSDSKRLFFADRLDEELDILLFESRGNSGFVLKHAPPIHLSELCGASLVGTALRNCSVNMRTVDEYPKNGTIKTLVQVVGHPARSVDFNYSQFK
jgi:hypothetical protein